MSNTAGRLERSGLLNALKIAPVILKVDPDAHMIRHHGRLLVLEIKHHANRALDYPNIQKQNANQNRDKSIPQVKLGPARILERNRKLFRERQIHSRYLRI